MADIAPEMRSRANRSVPTMRTVEEKLEHVARGRGMVILPRSATAYDRRPDITCVPVDDISPSRVSLARDATRRSRLIYEFADLATQHLQSIEPSP